MRKQIVITLAMLLLAGCGSSGMTRGDILKHYDKVNQFSVEVADAEGKEGALLAPEGFTSAKTLLDEAIEAAMDGDKADANAKSEEGLKILDGVRAHMKQSREEFEETLQTRERARLEGASGLYPDEWGGAEAEFKEAATLVEEGQVAEAREQRVALQKKYAALELKALKEGKKAAAEAAVEHAEDVDADDYAPKTYHKAKEELKLVTSVLEADRTQKEKADSHATHTIWLAGRAIAITELARMFEDGDYELEDIILWHQEQLDKVNQPLDSELPFDESDAKVVQALQNSVNGLLKSIADMRAIIKKRDATLENQEKKYEKKIADLLEEHSKQLAKLQNASASELSKLQKDAEARLAEANAALDAEAEKKKKYEFVASLFAKYEAEVSQQEENVLLSVHGFDFPTRGTDIGSQNFGLLDKIVSAINKFPKSNIVVTGHTDSRGGKERNYRLSRLRAESVGKFLTTIGGIEAGRIDARGEGETKPIASNDTRDGRAKNRRIEILIVVK